MDDETTRLVLAALGGLATPVIGAASYLFLRRRRGTRAHARVYFSLRTHERSDTHSKEPSPFPDKEKPPHE